METWRAIPGFEGRYEVSDLGRVRSLPRLVPCGRNGTGVRRAPSVHLRPGRMPSGHMSVALGRGNSRTVHSLVAETFIGPRPSGMEVLHINGNPADNRIDNLRYGTRSENNRDIFLHGRRRMTPILLREIKAQLALGVKGAELARLFGFSESQISIVKHGRQYVND